MESVVQSMLFDLTGQVALVTGASRGIGLAIAHELARAGAVVVLSSEDAEACESAAGELRRAGCGATALPCDVAVRREVEDLVQATFDLHGQIDILVCNATMTVNLRSILWLTNLVIPRMAARGQGSVIIVSSIAGVRGNKSIGLYGISKAGSAQLASSAGAFITGQDLVVDGGTTIGDGN